MAVDPGRPREEPRPDRAPPYSEEAEQGVLGSILLDSGRVMDLCVEAQLSADSFYVPAHRVLYKTFGEIAGQQRVVDLLTTAERLKSVGALDGIGGPAYLNRLVDFVPTVAHAEYYIDIVRQHHLRRSIIDCARKAEALCRSSEQNADELLGQVEQTFHELTEGRHGAMPVWDEAVSGAMQHIEQVLNSGRGLNGLSTGFANLDKICLGLRRAEMIVLAARPSMGKTSLAMNIAENVALGHGDPDHRPHPVGIFSLEMSVEALVMRMLCSHAGVSSFKLQSGYISRQADHGRLCQAASILAKAPIFLDDTGGLDIMELRARARRMRKRHGVELILIDYLQLVMAREHQRFGKQVEVSMVSNNLKAMAKELNVPVLVLSQLSRAPEQRGDRRAKPKLSDLRDSGAIEQDADVVWLLRRPCRYEADDEAQDRMLAYVDVAKHRNGPVGEVALNFEEEYTRFRDRAQGSDGALVDRIAGEEAGIDEG